MMPRQKNPLIPRERTNNPDLERQSIQKPEKPEEDYLSRIEDTEKDPLPKQTGRFYSGLTGRYHSSERDRRSAENTILKIGHKGNTESKLTTQPTELPLELKEKIRKAYFKKHGFDPNKHNETEFIEYIIKQERRKRDLDKKEAEQLRQTLTK